MIVFITVIFALIDITTKESKVDNWGHLGGFITGLPFSMSLMPIMATSMRRNVMPGWTYERYCKVFGGVVTVLWLGIGLIGFYTARNTTSVCSRISMVTE